MRMLVHCLLSLALLCSTGAARAWADTFGAAVAPSATAADVEAQRRQLEARMAQYVALAGSSAELTASGLSAPLVVLTSASATVKVDPMTEDLAIMSRILAKAAVPEKESGAGDADNASRRMTRLFGSGRQNPSSFYLEDFGALFLLSVDFALVPPPGAEAIKKEEKQPESLWDETRQELRGVPTGGVAKPPAGWPVMPEAERGYDAAKVKGLEDALVAALKWAGNIRQLAPETAIVITVIGTTPGATDGSWYQVSAPGGTTVALSKFYYGIKTDGAAVAGGRRTVMTIRATKADVDALAQGKLTADQFRQRAVILKY